MAQPLPGTSFVCDLFNQPTFQAKLYGQQGSREESALGFVHTVAKGGDPVHEQTIRTIADACDLDIKFEYLVDKSISIDILHYCSVYFDNIGNVKETISLSKKNLEYSKKYSDKNVIRRAHSVLASAHNANGSYTEALFHTYEHYKIAQEIGEQYAVYMSLCNTVSILETMGLMEDALRLSAAAAKRYSTFDEKMSSVHVVNTSNGMRLSHLLGDFKSASQLYEIGCKAVRVKSRYLTCINIANFDAACIVQLALQGKSDQAERLVNSYLSKPERLQNVKVVVLISIAQVESKIISGHTDKLRKIRTEVRALADRTKHFSEQYGELLQLLTKIDRYLESDVGGHQLSESSHGRMLKTHSLGVKHREYFANLARDNIADKLLDLLEEDLAYEVPSWITQVIEGANDNLKLSVKKVPHDLATLESKKSSQLGTNAFARAENWAIAVECALGSDGQNCFRVGQLAVAIARELGGVESSMSRLERACRLYDIGKVILAFSSGGTQAKARGRFSLFSRHPTAGAILLRVFDEDELSFAASIAEAHHEWWNGCGYPIGLKGDDILPEARICAVADWIVSSVFPPPTQPAWTIADVIKQVRTMAGVQFDPAVCSAVERIVERSSEGWWAENHKVSTLDDGMYSKRFSAAESLQSLS